MKKEEKYMPNRKTSTLNKKFYENLAEKLDDEGYMPVETGEDLSFLIGAKIDAVDGDIITLSDGSVFKLADNNPGGFFSSGNSYLENLASLPSEHCITDIQVKYNEGYPEDESFVAFIFYHDKRFDTAINGNLDYGIGYYGGGFHVYLQKTGEKLEKAIKEKKKKAKSV